MEDNAIIIWDSDRNGLIRDIIRSALRNKSRRDLLCLLTFEGDLKDVLIFGDWSAFEAFSRRSGLGMRVNQAEIEKLKSRVIDIFEWREGFLRYQLRWVEVKG